MKLENFYYELPNSFIAQEPLQQRDHSKLLLLDKKTGRVTHDIFYNVINYLKKGDILVLNESKVDKCRLAGNREKTGGKTECFILEKLKDNKYLVLLKPSKRIKENDVINIGEFFYIVEKKLDYGKAEVIFSDDIGKITSKYGLVPLPPYIKNECVDANRYQTIYAKTYGSAAAPTAGFHFTDELMERINGKGVNFAKLTLDIGLDTFRPIVEENVEEHVIHSEAYSLDADQAQKIQEARRLGGRVIAVGTTSVRVLETVMSKLGSIRQDKGNTSLYIYPGYEFKAVDGIITNFHLPHSTLLVMVSAFAGRENIINAYEEAKKNFYRFFSFGDCMLIY
jgi:S-adenosylmethionine:tRNA ribosyltransferase-isomerase